MKAKFLALTLSLALVSGAIADNIVFPPGGGGGSTSPTQVLNPIFFGAKCIGVTNDDTAALQLWATALNAGNNVGYVPGKCTSTLPIAFWPNGAINAGLIGDGATSSLIYTGANTTNDVFTIGQANVAASGCSMYNLTIRSVTFFSLTVMTAGTGLQINEGCQTDMSNVNVGTNLGANVGWYNAIHFNGCNTVHVRGYQFVGSHIAVQVNGDNSTSPGPYACTDPFFEQGIAVKGSVGFDFAGAVGGAIVDQTDALANSTNVLVSQSVIARPNLQLFFINGFFADVTSGGAGVGFDVTDPGGGTGISVLDFKNAWLASSTNECLKLETGTAWHVIMHGGEVINCHGAGGFWNNSINNVIDIEGTVFDLNSFAGFNNVVNDGQVRMSGVSQGIHGTNNFIGFPVSASYINPSNNIISQSQSAGAVISGTTQVVGGGAIGTCGLWYQSGIMVPGLTDFSTAGCPMLLGTGTFPLKSIGASQWLATGAAPAISGTCTGGTWIGGNTAGRFILTSNCSTTQSFVLTFATAAGAGWSCNGSDASQTNVTLRTSGFTTTTATIQPSGADASSGDNLIVACVAF